MERFKEYIMLLQPKYEVELLVEPEPDQTYLLGGRWQDFGLCFAFALGIPVIRWILRSSIHEPLGRYIIAAGGKGKLGPAKQERLRKWNESCWKFTVFLSFVVTAITVARKEKWFTDTRYYWLGCSHFPPCNLPVSRGVLFFYCLETGFYIQAIHFLMFHEVRRKDWLESMVHHIATVALLVYSYYVNFARVGTMVLLTHDISDIFLETAKLFRYARKQALAMVAFGTFLVVWIITRNIYYPAVIIRSTLTEPLHYADMHGIKNVEPHYTIFNSLLLLLLVLHIYWTWLIFKVLQRQLTTGDGRDVREGDASDSDDSDKDD